MAGCKPAPKGEEGKLGVLNRPGNAGPGFAPTPAPPSPMAGCTGEGAGADHLSIDPLVILCGGIPGGIPGGTIGAPTGGNPGGIPGGAPPGRVNFSMNVSNCGVPAAKGTPTGNAPHPGGIPGGNPGGNPGGIPGGAPPGRVNCSMNVSNSGVPALPPSLGISLCCLT